MFLPRQKLKEFGTPGTGGFAEPHWSLDPPERGGGKDFPWRPCTALGLKDRSSPGQNQAGPHPRFRDPENGSQVSRVLQLTEKKNQPFPPPQVLPAVLPPFQNGQNPLVGPGVAEGVQDFIADTKPFGGGIFLAPQGKQRGPAGGIFQAGAVDDLPDGLTGAESLFGQTHPFDEIFPPGLAVFGLLEKARS
jgi:hypothetical protein